MELQAVVVGVGDEDFSVPVDGHAHGIVKLAVAVTRTAERERRRAVGFEHYIFSP
ncbi:MAG TPA: hypothetical protein VF921_01365 [Vicinamibacterales bacterium]